VDTSSSTPKKKEKIFIRGQLAEKFPKDWSLLEALSASTEMQKHAAFMEDNSSMLHNVDATTQQRLAAALQKNPGRLSDTASSFVQAVTRYSSSDLVASTTALPGLPTAIEQQSTEENSDMGPALSCCKNRMHSNLLSQMRSLLLST
jgi:hypothetical protein